VFCRLTVTKLNKVGYPLIVHLESEHSAYFISFLIKKQFLVYPLLRHHRSKMASFLPSLAPADVQRAAQVRARPFLYTRTAHPSLAQLIQQSYDPISAHRLSPDDQRRLQGELFELQRRWEAWGLVVPFLFEYTDPNVQFFGAHTAQVKISRDWCVTQPPAFPAFLTPLCLQGELP
jgi:hypothetical protein